jgi:hypothetical protein
MKTKHNAYEPEYAVKDAPRVKTVDLRLALTDCNWEAKIKEAFHLARSGGLELNLDFDSGYPTHMALKRLHLR